MNEFHPKRILSAVDFSPVSAHVLQWARYFAGAFGAAVEVFHADHVEAPVYFTSGQVEALNQQLRDHRRSLEQLLRELAERSLGQGIEWNLKITEGPAIDTLQKRLETDQPDLVVMGSHGRSGVDRLLMGSVAENLVRHARCPILIVPARRREHDLPGIHAVLSPLNFTEAASRSLSVSASVARAFEAELRILHAIEDPKETEHDVLKRLCSSIDPDVRTICRLTESVKVGDAAEQILRFAAESRSDLIVMAADHRPFLEWSTIGTTTIRVMRHSSIPVLIIPARKA